MELIDDAAERVTAATDLLLAIVALVGVRSFRTNVNNMYFKVNLWSIIYALFIAAALLGTVHHGLTLSSTIYDLTWLGVLLSLGIMIGLFVVALTLDLAGRNWAVRLTPVMLMVAIGFFVFSWANGQDFSLFLAYEALALLAALAGWGWLAWRGEPGAALMSLGVLITIVAAIIQATGMISYTLIVPFDHNANYHLVQCIAILLLTAGITRATAAPG